MNTISALVWNGPQNVLISHLKIVDYKNYISAKHYYTVNNGIAMLVWHTSEVWNVVELESM